MLIDAQCDRRNLGPGSENLLPLLLSPDLPLERRIDSTKQMREFDTHDWSNLVEVFKNWKFAPEVSVHGFRRMGAERKEGADADIDVDVHAGLDVTRE